MQYAIFLIRGLVYFALREPWESPAKGARRAVRNSGVRVSTLHISEYETSCGSQNRAPGPEQSLLAIALAR